MALPGQKFINGVSNYIFGTNTPNYDTALFSNTNVQQQMKASGITVIRTSITPSGGGLYTDAQIDQAVNTIISVGAQPLVILPHAQDTYNKHVVTYLGSRCNLYEYSNEPDINGISVSAYSSQFINLVPALRIINPNAAYIGPVLAVFGNLNSYLVPFLNNCKTAGVIPDAVSVHIYPCTNGTASIAQSTCMTNGARIGTNMATLRSTIISTLGFALPVCLTEWNADAYYANATSPKSGSAGQGYNSNASANDTFNAQFATQVLESLVANSVDMGCHFELEYFLANKNSLTSTTPQYQSMSSEIAKYLGSGGSTPPGGGGSSFTSIGADPGIFDVSGVAGGAPIIQYLTLSNSGNVSGTFTRTISYSAFSTLNWVTISASSTTIAASGTNVVTLTITPNVAMTAGTFTAILEFTMDGLSIVVDVNLTVSASTNTISSSIYVPAYAYPTDPNGTGTTWKQYQNSAVSLIIANPSAGPGNAIDSNFINGITTMHQAGVKVLGYVSTSTSGNLLTETTVKAQIDNWYSWYNIDGIYLDNALATFVNFTYFNDLFSYIKTKSSARNYVMLNAAQVPGESYTSIADTIVVYQDTLSNISGFVQQAYMTNYPAVKFAAAVTGVSTNASVDSTMTILQNSNIGLIYITDQTGLTPFLSPPGNTIWTETIKKSNISGTGIGGTLSLYLASSASTVLTTANVLYSKGGGTVTPSNIWKYSRIGTAIDYGEITSQGTTTAWAAVSTLPAPTGKGFLYDTTALVGNKILAGSWSAIVRLNAAQNGDAASNAGTLIGDIVVRVSKYNTGTYTTIITMTLVSQTVPSAFTNFSLSGSTSSSTTFSTGDKLYIDYFFKVTSNANGSSVQDIRLNRESQDTTNFTGDDSSAIIVTPGYSNSNTVSKISYSVLETTTGTETVTLTTYINNNLQALINERAFGSESLTVSLLILSDANASMTTIDLNFEYGRILQTFSAGKILLIAIVYYGNAANSQTVYGELDVLLVGETIDQLHVLKTINQVNTFIRNYSR